MSFHSASRLQQHTSAELPVSKDILQHKYDCNQNTFEMRESSDLHSSGKLGNQEPIDTFTASRFEQNFSQVKLHHPDATLSLPSRRTQLIVQRIPQNEDNGFVPSSASPEAESRKTSTSTETSAETAVPVVEAGRIATPTSEQETELPAKTPTSGLIVEDSTAELGPGQMRKSEFLIQLRIELTRTAEVALSGTGHTTMDFPYVNFLVAYYSRLDGINLERAIYSYAPETAGISTAIGYIPIIAQQVRLAIETWTRTQEITNIPEPVSPNLFEEKSAGIGTTAATPTDPVRFKAQQGGARTVNNPRNIQKELGEGRSLDSGVRSHMESAFGTDFSHVRTHTDTTAGRLSNDLNARAFTVGKHVAFGANEYKPGTLIGDALIAHELAHVVQQSGGGASAVKMQGGDAAYDSLENDADKSAVGVLVSLWYGGKEKFADIAQSAVPKLRSGLSLQRCDHDSSPSATSTTTTLKGVTNADGKGWLNVIHADGSKAPPLPQYLKVDHTNTSGGREYFTIKESGRNGKFIGKTGSVIQKSGGGSYLASGMTYKGAASVEFDKSTSKLRYGSSGSIATITQPGNPIPNGTHDLEIPYEPHPGGSGYESTSKYAKTWFRAGHSGDRFLHPGSVTAGCATVTDVSAWNDIYNYLINSRKDSKNVGTITVK